MALIKHHFFTIGFLLLHVFIYCQSITGPTGIINIPTAEMQPDGTFYVGAAYFNKKYNGYVNYKYDAIPITACITFLPFVEISARITSLIGYHGEKKLLGDRMPNIKIRITKEDKFLPALAVGVNSFVGILGGEDATHFNSTYIVATKSIKIFDNQIINNTIGYGFDFLEANDYQFTGLFGGISYQPLKWLNVETEFDGDKVNLGLRSKIANHIVIITGIHEFKKFTAAVYISAKL